MTVRPPKRIAFSRFDRSRRIAEPLICLSPSRENMPSTEFPSRAVALNSEWSRGRPLSTRCRVESSCYRPEIESRAHALDSTSGRQHLLSTRTRVGRTCSRAAFDSRANAHDSLPRASISRQSWGLGSICARGEFNLRASALNSIPVESRCFRLDFESRADALDSISRREALFSTRDGLESNRHQNDVGWNATALNSISS